MGTVAPPLTRYENGGRLTAHSLQAQLLASDADCTVAVHQPIRPSAHSELRSDGGGSLFGVLPEPCCAWAAMQPLADLLPTAAAVATTPLGPAAASIHSSPMDTASQPDVHQQHQQQHQHLSLPSLALQRCRVSRSRVVARPRDGRQLVATLLHVQWAPGEEPQGLSGRPGARGAAGRGVGGSVQAADAAPWLWDRPADQLVRVHKVVLGASLTVGSGGCVKRDGQGHRGRGGGGAAEGDTGGGELVEFRYIFDDARLGWRRGKVQGWSEQEDGLHGEGSLGATAGGAGGRGDCSPTQLQAHMAGAAGCTPESAKGIGAGRAALPPPPPSGGGGTSRHLGRGLARWMQQQLQGPEVHQQQAQGHQEQQQAGGEGGGGQGPQAQEPETAGAAAGRGAGELHGAVERYFTDELAADARGLLVCPMCSAGCVGVQVGAGYGPMWVLRYCMCVCQLEGT